MTMDVIVAVDLDTASEFALEVSVENMKVKFNTPGTRVCPGGRDRTWAEKYRIKYL